MNKVLIGALTLLMAAITILSGSALGELEAGQAKQFILNPIGTVQKEGGRTSLVIHKQFQPALLGLKSGDHIWVMYWFDRNDTPAQRTILQVHPRRNPANPLTGVFASRAPVRPNLIGLSLCKILAVKGNLVAIEDIDAFDNTPILDIKPYAAGIDTP